MKTSRTLLLLAFVAFTVRAETPSPRVEWFRGFQLEEAARGANLIMAAQIIEAREVKSNFAGKSFRVTNHEYRLKPAGILKGIFARSEMTLSDSDLDVRSEALKQGSFVLLFLGRSEMGYRNSNGNGNFESTQQSIPPLSGMDDPLLDCAKVFLAVNAETDRARRVDLLLAGLRHAEGSGAVALLQAIRPRALFAAQNPETGPVISPFLTSKSPAVREAAAKTLGDILHADYAGDSQLHSTAAETLVSALRLKSTNIPARSAEYHAIAELGRPGHDDKNIRAILLEDIVGESIEEQDARLEAIGALRLEEAAAHEMGRYRSLPLDASSASEQVVATTAAALNGSQLSDSIQRRSDAKLEAGLSIEPELRAAASLAPESGIPLLLNLWHSPLNASERETFASLSRKICVDDHHPDPRFVAPLETMLAPSDEGRQESISALRAIDTDEAAAALKPHLVEENNLGVKLAMAQTLGKHGMTDGYPYAMEHLSEPWLLDAAISALAAIQGKDAAPDARLQLKTILETSNDTGWNSAAIRALGGLGAADMTPKFLAFASDPRSPLAIPALIALADLGRPEVLDLVVEDLNSRNDKIVRAAADAALRLAHGKQAIADKRLTAGIAALLSDSQAETESRELAMNALLTWNDPGVNDILKKVVREANLEGSEFMKRVERLLSERKVKLG